MREMTSRERVYAAANFKEPDRVPISFGAATGTHITECPPNGLTCSHLYEYLGLKDAEPVKISPAFNQVVNLDERVMRRLHSDMRQVGPNLPPPNIETDGTKTWPWFCGMRIKKTGYYDEPFDFPLRHMTTKEGIDEYPWPDTSVNIMEGVVERARYLHDETDHFIVGRCMAQTLPFAGYGFLSGIDKWLLDIKTNPKFYHQLSEKLLEIGLAFGDQFYGGIGQYLDGGANLGRCGDSDGSINVAH